MVENNYINLEFLKSEVPKIKLKVKTKSDGTRSSEEHGVGRFQVILRGVLLIYESRLHISRRLVVVIIRQVKNYYFTM